MKQLTSKTLTTASTFAIALSLCSCGFPINESKDSSTLPPKVSDSISQDATIYDTDEQKQLSSYRFFLENLKTVKNPPVNEDCAVITATDIQAAENRRTGSQQAYIPTSESSIDTTQLPQTYSGYAPRNLGYTSTADRNGVGAVFAAREALKSGDYSAAARSAQTAVENAYRTGDADAIKGTEALRDAIRRTTGH